MAPAVAKATKVRRTAALVRPERNRNFRDARAELRGLDHELRRKFHSCAAQIHAVVNGASEAAHAAVAVADARVKKKIQDRGEHRIAKISVMPGHRAGLDF